MQNTAAGLSGRSERIDRMATAILKKGEGRSMKAGGMWIYDNEIDRV